MDEREADGFEKLYLINDLSRKIDECENLSATMKAVSALVALVDLLCVRRGGIYAAIISILAVIIFFVLTSIF